MSESTPKPSIGWQAVQSRVTVFHSGDASTSNLSDWWKDAFGAIPLLRDETRHLEGVRSVGGVVNDTMWTANAGSERTDFILQPNNNMPPEPGTVWGQSTVAGPHHTVAHSMGIPIHKYLAEASRVNRLAFGAVFVAPGPSLDAVIATLSGVLPQLGLDGLKTPDFVFRINRRRQSRHSPAVTINRLFTWSIAQGQTVTLAAGPQPSQSHSIQYAANVELDINTVPVTPRGIPVEKSVVILDELVDLALEIVEKGDVL
jgi:hypothetical protein